jgi:hypothetical protein
MARYTPEFLAVARHGYENTDQPMRELARELGIGITTLSTLAENNGWAKRSQRKRGLPPAMQLLAEARALASQSGHSRDAPTLALRATARWESAEARSAKAESGNPVLADGAEAEPPKVLGPRFRGGERRRVADPEEATATPTLPPSGGGSALAPVAADPPSLLDRMEQILEQLIAAEEAAPATGTRSPQSARNLATLIQAMRALKGMRGNTSTDTGPIEDDDDDLPTDIDEFRDALARRIEAFMESRPDEGDIEPADAARTDKV